MRVSKKTIFLSVPVITMVVGMSAAFAQTPRQQQPYNPNEGTPYTRWSALRAGNSVEIPYRGRPEVGPEDQMIHPYEAQQSFW
jgi:hypothetical protein